jgi:hypothetical protein
MQGLCRLHHEQQKSSEHDLEHQNWWMSHPWVIWEQSTMNTEVNCEVELSECLCDSRDEHTWWNRSISNSSATAYPKSTPHAVGFTVITEHVDNLRVKCVGSSVHIAIIHAELKPHYSPSALMFIHESHAMSKTSSNMWQMKCVQILPNVFLLVGSWCYSILPLMLSCTSHLRNGTGVAQI